MPEATMHTQPVCENCGGKIRRRKGVWVHDETRAVACDTAGTPSSTMRKAEPKDEIR